MPKQLCLKWNDHTSNLLEVFDNLLSTEAFVDVTLACEGSSLKAHKIVLSACSPFFKSLFLENPSKHPIVILKDVKYYDLKAVVKFIYSGEVNVSQDQLLSFLLTAETLQVKGLEKISAENRHALGLGEQRNLKQTNVSTPISPPITQSPQKTTRSSLQCKRKRSGPPKLNDDEVTVKIKAEKRSGLRQDIDLSPSNNEEDDAKTRKRISSDEEVPAKIKGKKGVEFRQLIDLSPSDNEEDDAKTRGRISADEEAPAKMKEEKSVGLQQLIDLSASDDEEDGAKTRGRVSPDKEATVKMKGKKRASFRQLIDLSLNKNEEDVVKMRGRVSPDVMELSNDVMYDFENDIRSGGGPSSLFMVSLHSLDSVKSSSKKSYLSNSQDNKITDDVNEMEVVPSNLLEQTLIVENSPVNENNREHTQLPSIRDSETTGEFINNTGVFSQTLISPDLNLETLGSAPDVKSEIVTDDLTLSPVAGPSHSSGKSWTQVDHSDVSLISGSKNGSTVVPCKSSSKRRSSRRKKQSKNDSIETEPWRQILHMCSDCSYTNANIEELVSHIEFHKKSATQCEFCKISFTELCSSEHPAAIDETVVDCDICDHRFCSKMALLTHKLLHHY